MEHKITAAVLVLLVVCQVETVSSSSGVQLLGKTLRFKSKNFPNRYIRHRNLEMWLDQWQNSNLYKLDSAFDMVPGLAGHGISFRSKNYPAYFLRHRGYKCFIHKSDGSDLFKKDATWMPEYGLVNSGPWTVSFQSYNFPGYYMRHSGFRVRIDPNVNTQLFKKDASWIPHNAWDAYLSCTLVKTSLDEWIYLEKLWSNKSVAVICLTII